MLTLNRPERRNALDTALLRALLDALGEAGRDGGVRAVVLAGAGGAFSAGADVREELDHGGLVRRTDLFARVYEAIAAFPRPTVAAVTGPCVGGGAEAAAACDLRVAEAGATFRFPGAAMGIPVGAAKLVGLVGLGTAKDLVLTSRTIDAAEAHRVGLVQRLVPDGEGLAAALEVATAIAERHADAVAHVRRLFDRFGGLSERVAIENDALRAVAEAAGDYSAVTLPDPRAGRGR